MAGRDRDYERAVRVAAYFIWVLTAVASVMSRVSDIA